MTLCSRQQGASSGSVENVIDNLTYSYYSGNMSNRLQKITEASQNYSGYPYRSAPADIPYDLNGNMTNYIDKEISSIAYNHLNLPTNIVDVNDDGLEQITQYLYRADGTKVRKTFNEVVYYQSAYFIPSTKIVDYIDGFQYQSQTDLDDPYTTPPNVLKFIPTSEGYFDFEKNAYIYNYTDHLGNTRLSYTKSDSGTEIIDESNYYPFGLKHDVDQGLAINNAYNYKYNGKELQETGMYDYGARFYMPDIGRWGVVDPLAEKYSDSSPYVYTANNPINLIDPDGQSWEPFDKKGNTVKVNDYDNISGYRWVDYDTNKDGNKVARANTVETAYVFGVGGMTTLSSEGYTEHRNWQAYEDISTGSESTDKKIASLHPSVQNQMKSFLLMAKYRFDVDLRVTDGFRSVVEQDKLYAKGRTAKGSIVTKAKGGQSNHNFGLAVDVVPMENGELNWETKNWSLIGRIGESRGLEWGGKWKFLDRPHFQNLQGKTLKQLQSLPKKNGLPILK